MLPSVPVPLMLERGTYFHGKESNDARESTHH